MKPATLLILPAITALSLTSCVVPAFYDDPGGYGYGTYTALPGTYVGDAYYYGDRYYYGGRYESGRYYHQGRPYSNRYYHNGQY